MPWPVHPNGLLGAQGDSDSYRIERSLRFNSADDAYLNRTPASAGNRKTWTWSGWVKKCKNEAFQQIFSNLTAANSNGFIFRFDNDDTLAFGNFTSAYTAARETNRVFRDNSSWYHIVATWDTTNATASDRIKIYINGIEETSFKTTTNPSLNADGFINNTNLHAIGRAGSVAGSYFDGYLAEINFIDG
ncbi:MAG: LamG domain-containing protein, partial [Caulobacteraceae bacterium]|nr:LamG domain-containing protein [Caulobacteraceae bacterium]